MKNKKYAIPYRDKKGKLLMVPGINNFGDRGKFNPGSRIHSFKLRGSKIIEYFECDFKECRLHIYRLDSLEINFGEN